MGTKKFNFAIKLKKLSGEDYTEKTLNPDGTIKEEKPIIIGQSLAAYLSTEPAKDKALETYALIKKIYNAEREIEITLAEKKIIEDFCLSGRLTVLMSAQIMEILNS